MPFQPDQVHVFSRRSDGGERLARTSYYKRFVKQGPDGVNASFNAQGGAWWTDGGEKIREEDIPEWVWKDVRDMDIGYRRMYRILTPEERKSGELMPTVETAAEWPTVSDIIVALGKLDPTDDLEWDKDGKPKLLALKRVLGTYVTREKLNSIAPDFVRPYVEPADEDA